MALFYDSFLKRFHSYQYSSVQSDHYHKINVVDFHSFGVLKPKQSTKKSEIFSLYLLESSVFASDNKLFLYLFNTRFATDHVYFTS
ncbi:hypothetical protein DP83_08900 [Vibrio metoecus]|uniref:Uncharacterized protein n=1 Tax=Vibrio metoecus TaxID=1481663 RepID=A0ABR4S042_VIBMT|nr:hypothetical protein DP83_08900 [Vibrio metoecus]